MAATDQLKPKATPRPWSIVGLFLVGAVVGWLFKGAFTSPQEDPGLQLVKLHPASSSQYKFVRPLMGCRVASGSKQYLENTALESRISSVIDGKKEFGDITEASVYVRELETGRWTGVNEDAAYNPASLFKLPTMIAYLKKAESNTALLQSQISLAKGKSDDAPQEIPPEQSIEYDRPYAVEDLIRYMIVYSDNRATAALDKILVDSDLGAFKEILTDFGVPPASKDGKFSITAKQYAGFFSVLYNGSYLSDDMSEKALGLMAQGAFKDGIRAGVPDGVSVANKFGEYGTLDGDHFSERQLHDCGIVYVPGDPYVLCVMTRGKDLDKLKGTIRDISAAVYGVEVGGGKH
ncbi:MAG: hypothetical protein RLZZ324_678 [Candidatus Parcubacteria bacterium]|jgi:beta-lactamase class A